ncbi:sodium-coupled neutral amino acid transporter 7-like [Oppia nitens]|uniref:sodium-coupled neutral amino acid transporter 7-like n=1 Tax=Oppia nitens TaxID=1686743 RepID=UPI0023D9DEA1|nr:sodium-coupled neutral amino acid transporter 7-like [Oppia nitens]
MEASQSFKNKTMESSILMDSSITKRPTDRPTRQRKLSGSFIHDSINSSVDFPAYIPWQTLSSDLSDRLRQGSVRINRSNIVEWATIKEENERAPLLEHLARKPTASTDDSSGSASEYSKHGATDALSGGSTWRVGAFLLVNAALGAGVLNYPVAYDRLGGITIATFVQLVIIAMLATTMLILIYCSDINNDSTYHDVLLSMCGKRAQQLAAASIMCTCFGINVTFLIIIGDQYDRIFATYVGSQFCHLWYLNRNFTISITAIVCIWTMCYYKRLDFLRYASTLGVFAMLYVVFLNVYEYIKLDTTPGPIKTSPHNAVSLFAALPVVCFAYQTHEIVVPIYACMSERKLKSFSKATALALLLLFLLYCFAGTFGYLTFGAYVSADIMQLFDARDPVVAAGIIALIIKMITTYAPLMFCGRGALDGLYAELTKLSAEDFILGEFKRRIVITTIWNVVVLILSIVTPNITIAIELLGSLASCNVFIFPGLCMVALAKRRAHLGNNVLFNKSLLIYGVVVILTGAFIFVIVFIQVINDLLYSEGESLLCN